MHSVRHSRSRVLFEVFCALAMSASFAGAWMQTGASALLAAAGVAALYALVHMFDLGGSKPHGIVDRPEVKDVPSDAVQPVARRVPVEAAVAIEEAAGAEPAAPQKRPSRAKSRRKSADRQVSAPDEPTVTEFAPPVEAEVAFPEPSAEVTHLHIEPLFEAEPFTRMPRPAFGRKAG
jgi:hypothetical protein